MCMWQWYFRLDRRPPQGASHASLWRHPMETHADTPHTIGAYFDAGQDSRFHVIFV